MFAFPIIVFFTIYCKIIIRIMVIMTIKIFILLIAIPPILYVFSTINAGKGMYFGPKTILFKGKGTFCGDRAKKFSKKRETPKAVIKAANLGLNLKGL
ncbi:hypothetical protein ES708_34841 [subsurface metagenome]